MRTASPETWLRAISSVPCTVRFPVWIWKPAKSVPSYSTVMRIVRAVRLTSIAGTLFDEFDQRHLGRIAQPLAETDQPSVPARTLGEARPNDVEQLLDDLLV